MYNKHYLGISALALLAFTACEPEIDRALPDPEVARGNADFTTYVALGNSLTAGYADGALNREGQLNSYPAIIADRIQYIQPELEFVQPLLPVGTANGTILLTGFDANGLPIISIEGNGLTNEQIYAPVSGTFQNLGVPGATVGQLLFPGFGNPANGEGNYNPYFTRFATDPATSSVVEMAIAQNPTFFTLWIGNNDVLGYATQGGKDNDSERKQPEITDPGAFDQQYKMLVGAIIASNPDVIEGALGNIPNIAAIPYFNTVAWNNLVITADQAAQLNAGFYAGVRAEVEAQVVAAGGRRQVIRGVIETGARREVILGVITEGARIEIINEVAPAVVYQQAFDEAKNNGATDEEAAVQAQAYVESADGQAEIEALKNSLISEKQPAEVHAIVESQLESEAVQAEIQVAYEAAIAADEDGDPDTTLEQVIGTEGAAAVEATYNSAEVQGQIEAAYQASIAADEDDDPNTTIAQVIGEEGAAAVEATYNQVVEDQTQGFIASIDDKYFPEFTEGANGFVVGDENSPTGFRQLVAGEKITLRFLTDNIAGQLPTLSYIVPDKYALDADEIDAVESAIQAYNNTIREVATEYTLAHVDMNAIFADVVDANGLTDDGTTFTNAFITGNAFSLDGVHLTQKGYALVAKKFIQEINSTYGSKIPEPNLRLYPAVRLPAGATTN